VLCAAERVTSTLTTVERVADSVTTVSWIASKGEVVASPAGACWAAALADVTPTRHTSTATANALVVLMP
jgi:hypothetical protein